MNREIVWTTQFKKDYKLALKRHLDSDLFGENSSVVFPLVSPAISLPDTFPRTSACIHNCISYNNTPNTGCPVLGVHTKLAQ